MNNIFLSLIIFFICNVNSIFAQNSNMVDSKIEHTPDSIIFQTYIDSIEKYVYRDSRKIIEYKLLCEAMMAQGKELSNANRFDFVIQNIYYQYTKDELIKVAEIIESNRKMMKLDGISSAKKKSFKYLDGYTAMIMGDSELAQESFHQLLEDAIEQNDYQMMYKSTCSLGEVFIRQNQLKVAEKHLLDALKTSSYLDKNSTLRVHVFLEIVKLYIKEKAFDKADHYNDIGMNLSDSLNMLDFKFDFLLNKIVLLTNKNKIIAAENFYQDALALAKLMENFSYERQCKEVYAKILDAKTNYNSALRIYDELIEEEEKEQNVQTALLMYYDSAHKIAGKNGNNAKAYRYLLKSNEIKENLDLEEQLQKTKYVQIKFQAQQKEKENKILTAQILQKKSQNQLLYALALIFALLIILLFRTVVQKRNYNQQLQKEVKIRTQEFEKANILLSKSNEELNQFNNILSHDLKEPLRSIVGFSSLAKKEAGDNNRLAEYLNFINKSGRQLNQLIDDVAVFQNIGNQYVDEYKYIDLNKVTQSILESIQPILNEKNAKVNFSNLPTIYSNSSIVFIVFKNLIENGIKYNQSDVPTINIKYQQNEKSHTFLFQDNGIGIASEFHEKVFGMFKRLNDRGTYEGSGLGLNIVKKIMDKIDGDIKILTSEEEKGSVFEVSFPLNEDKESHLYKMKIPNSN